MDRFCARDCRAYIEWCDSNAFSNRAKLIMGLTILTHVPQKVNPAIELLKTMNRSSRSMLSIRMKTVKNNACLYLNA